MALQADGKGALAVRLGHLHPPSYPFRLRYKDDIERFRLPAPVTGPITTPWRVVLIGKDLTALVNTTLIGRLSPPPDRRLFPLGSQTQWIKPGRAVWKYLDGGENTADTVREFSRLASQLGFEYQVVEGFWQKWPKDELRDVIAESRKLGVGLWLWKHSNQLRTPESREHFFDLCREVGAAGVKIDFFDHEAKEVVELYEVMLREAAQRRLLVNFHGANKPTGESHTWPNELTREAVRGMESRRSDRSAHDATIPFTRLLAGPADYTPVHFGERRNDTTWAHQIATAVVMTSPLLTYSAHPKTILENPAVDLIKSIPATWDQTLVLPDSEIGELAVLARRSGTTWFVAGLNGPTARSVKVDLGLFLPHGIYQAFLARDVPGNATAVHVERITVDRSTPLSLETSAGGGFLLRISGAGF
jgi:alpha-glucosidase